MCICIFLYRNLKVSLRISLSIRNAIIIVSFSSYIWIVSCRISIIYISINITYWHSFINIIPPCPVYWSNIVTINELSWISLIYPFPNGLIEIPEGIILFILRVWRKLYLDIFTLFNIKIIVIFIFKLNLICIRTL